MLSSAAHDYHPSSSRSHTASVVQSEQSARSLNGHHGHNGLLNATLTANINVHDTGHVVLPVAAPRARVLLPSFDSLVKATINKTAPIPGLTLPQMPPQALTPMAPMASSSSSSYPNLFPARAQGPAPTPASGSAYTYQAPMNLAPIDTRSMLRQNKHSINSSPISNTITSPLEHSNFNSSSDNNKTPEQGFKFIMSSLSYQPSIRTAEKTLQSLPQSELVLGRVRQKANTSNLSEFEQLTSVFVSDPNFEKNVRKYKCDTCDKRFKTIGHFNRHKATHTGQRPDPASQVAVARVSKKLGEPYSQFPTFCSTLQVKKPKNQNGKQTRQAEHKKAQLIREVMAKTSANKMSLGNLLG